jgi:tRNA(adenine34) deaminase
MTDAESWMDLAMEEARAAAAAGEVPVGAIVLRDGVVLGRGRNTTEDADDPSGHAEVNALRAAGTVDGDWRLEGTTLVVTLEPCTMCIGAIALARVERLVFGARDPRLGACGSILDLTGAGIAPHLREVEGGVREEECGEMLREFFRALR